jgi:NADPH:quinone reductase-like Zn-dependent oxidoreductase
MKALTLDAESKTAVVQEVPLPKPESNEVLIQVCAVALNPVDALYVSNPLASTGRTVGSDFAGIVVASSAQNENVKPGQRVAGFLQGACSVNIRPGAFANYLVCPVDLLWQVPDSMSFEDAATVSLCALTAAQAIFYRMGLQAPFPCEQFCQGNSRDDAGLQKSDDSGPFSFFIYGASTSVGLYAAQLVRRSAEVTGRTAQLIGAANSARFPMLQAEPYAYDALIDYRDNGWPERVRELSGGGVNYAFDCISEGSTVQSVNSTLRNSHSRMAIVRSREGGAWTTDTDLPIEPIYGAVWEGLGVEIQYQNLVVPASPAARDFAVTFYQWLSGGYRLQATPVRSMPGGLDRIVADGFVLLGTGSMEDRVHEQREEEWMKLISAEKLVYIINADPAGRGLQD